MFPQAETFILSCERPELLACTLASVCGFNRGCGLVRVLDDGSTDPRVEALCTRYHESMLLASYERVSHGGIGRLRRTMIERFLSSGALRIVQVEGDMLLAPGAERELLLAWDGLRARGYDVRWLNTHNHDWAKRILTIQDVPPYRIGFQRDASEPFWMTDRETLAGNLDALPAERPDLIPFLNRVGATILFTPQIQAQHLGAVSSILYPQFAWHHVVYHDNDGTRHDNGPLRQPFPFLGAWDFPRLQREYPASILSIYEALRAHCPIPLPEFPA